MKSDYPISSFDFATDGVSIKSDVARSEIAISAFSMEKQGKNTLANLTLRELKDALYDLKFLDKTKKVHIRDVCLSFAGAERCVETCIHHCQRLIDHHNRFDAK